MQLADVTLREGGQMPGRDYSAEQKIAAGQTLDRLGISYIQAGFPVTGDTDRRAIDELAATVDADVIGLARAIAGDVDAALSANADIVEVFVPVSDALLDATFAAPRETMLEALVDAVDRVRDGGAKPHVTLTDAFRADGDHIEAVFELLPNVPSITLADTVGIRTPSEVRAFLDELMSAVDLSRMGVHFHDDLGVATANVLTAYDAGVGKADVSIAALGERAGNACLEEVVVAASVSGMPLAVDESIVIPISRSVLDLLGEAVDPRKSVLGAEVFQHESGLHTTVMLDDPSVFEPFPPSRYGGERRLLFGTPTGRGSARKLLERAGAEPTDERVADLLEALSEHGPVELDEAVDLARRFAIE